MRAALPLALTLVATLLLSSACEPAAVPGDDAPAGGTSDTTLVIRGVTIVDVERGALLADRTVLVRGRRIVSVDSGVPAAGAGATVVDGAGKYLIPGLWDMHVHAARGGRAPSFWPLFLAHGVTGVRETGSFLDSLLYWREMARREPRASPRVIWSSPMLDGDPPTYAYARTIATPAQARAAVAEMDSLDFDYLKIYSGLSRASFLAVADEARRRGVQIAGEVPNAVSPVEAAEAGMRSFEHLWNLFESCVPGAGALRDSIAALDNRDAPDAERRPLRERQWSRWRTGYDTACADTLALRLRRAGTWQVPTLVVNRSYSFPDSTWGNDVQRAAVAADVLAGWDTTRAELVAEYGATGAVAWRARWTHERDIMQRMLAEGVGFLAGSDASNEPYSYAGSSLHEELVLLVQAGLSPLQALQAATINPARFLHATDSLGTVAPGKLADLVLLDANPLVDIRHTTRIHGVVREGHWLDRPALDGLLVQARKAANRTR
ncbi:MAG: amidohydrolase family protein [Gemmatimonadota bacterium]